MRLLTFMQLAESRKEITFEVIQQELQIGEDAVEPFIIDGKLDSLSQAQAPSEHMLTCSFSAIVLKTKLVRAKIDQLNKKVLVTSTMHRTFGKAQWQQLKDTLTLWQFNLNKVQHTIAAAVRTQNQLPA